MSLVLIIHVNMYDFALHLAAKLRNLLKKTVDLLNGF